MRLAVAGGSLGLELYESVPLGPVSVEALSWSLPELKFPVDLSGGVELFRHRRGRLEHLRIRSSFEQLATYLRPRLREALGKAHAAPRLWPVAQGVGVGLAGEQGALAFELLFAPTGADARFVVASARGAGGVTVPLAHALRVTDTLFGEQGERSGRIVRVRDLGRRIARRVAPRLGARAPSAAHSSIEMLHVDERGVELRLRSGGTPPELRTAVVRALELAQLCAEADDALARGEVERARSSYVSALESAPRHPEVTAIVAQIDTEHGERGEAALGMLVECMPATRFGPTGARLLAKMGDQRGAREAVSSAASQEVYPPLAACLWHELAQLSEHAAERSHALDRAVAAAPSLASVRWARLEARAAAGNRNGAVADAESLEAAARGARQRHDVLNRAGHVLVGRGLPRTAGQLFERSLRYLPDDPDATFGLARSLLQTGAPSRAIVLLERTIELAAAQGTECSGALVELSKLLAERLRDLPQAIARVTRVSAASDLRQEALALEGRWRSRLGDLRGASLAYARLREACEMAGSKAGMPEAVHWLTEAAELERRSLGDLAAAERHLAAALRLSPTDRKVRRLYRRAAGDLARQEPHSDSPPMSDSSIPTPRVTARRED